MKWKRPAASQYHVDPNRAEAGQVFQVKITAAEFQCGSSFDSLSVEAAPLLPCDRGLPPEARARARAESPLKAPFHPVL